MSKHESALQHLKQVAEHLESESRVVQTVLEKIKKNDPGTDVVELHYVTLNAKTVERIGKALRKNSVVRELKLGGNQLGDDGIITLFDLIADNAYISSVDISFNEATDKSLQHILTLVDEKKVPALKEVTLFGNSVSDELENKLMSALAVNRTAEAIKLRTYVKRKDDKKSSREKGKRRTSRSDREKEKEKEAEEDKKNLNKSKSSAHGLSLSSSTADNDASEDHNKARKSKSNDSRRVSETLPMRAVSAVIPSADYVPPPGFQRSRRKAESTEENVVLFLHQKLEQLEQSERQYIARIEDMEQKILQMNKDKGGKANLFLRPFIGKSEKGRKMTINLDQTVITQRLAATGGSNAGVYSCLVDGWACAMKELDLNDMDDGTISAFEGEIRLLELMPRHDNIVRYLFHTTVDNKMRLFMTQYSGTLGSYIHNRELQNHFFSLKEIIHIATDIVKGLEFLHSQSIVHRDMKSDNVFILYDEHKQVKTAAIGDFDTAKRISSRAEKAKTVLGTPSWMAPEVMNANTDGEYNISCDIYSFGMVLYELLTLKMPYWDINPMLVAMTVLNGKKPTPPNCSPEYAPLVKLYEACTSTNPEHRPTASDVRQQLQGMA